MISEQELLLKVLDSFEDKVYQLAFDDCYSEEEIEQIEEICESVIETINNKLK